MGLLLTDHICFLGISLPACQPLCLHAAPAGPAGVLGLGIDSLSLGALVVCCVNIAPVATMSSMGSTLELPARSCPKPPAR